LIETISGDIKERSTRGMGFRYMDSLESYSGSRKWIKNEKRSDVRAGIEGSGRTFFDKDELP
jgi:hypothetical protein